MSVHKYRKLPISVSAIQLKENTVYRSKDVLDENSESVAEVSGWLLAQGFRSFKVTPVGNQFGITLATLEGDMLVSPGDYIIRGVRGEFYPNKKDIFEETYERLDIDE